MHTENVCARSEANLANKLPTIIILFAEVKNALFAMDMKTAERGQLCFITRIDF
jgi:hypothetical protein